MLIRLNNQDSPKTSAVRAWKNAMDMAMSMNEERISMQAAERILVFVPTFNERDNAPLLIAELQDLSQSHNLNLDLLFLDDHSPDGTGQVLDELAAKWPNLSVIHRTGKLGIGSAHFEGIRWAYEQGYKILITMDCDFTHPPRYIPELIRASEGKTIALGSRYLQKKSLKEWNLFRKTLTTLGHLMTTRLLGMPYDATGAFRLYRLDQIPEHAFQLIHSRGYSFFFESLYILNLNAYPIAEIPIELPARTYGHSKMSYGEVWKSVKFLFTLYITTLLNRERFTASEPFEGAVLDPTRQDKQGWDDYWQAQKGAGGILYDSIAAFYRKFIIRRTLNHFVKRYFTKGGNVLHAGCGSGQVDTDIRHWVKITGLDISVNALNFYKKTNADHCQVLHGSIFEIPLKDETLDGIYNLGVMEHFTETEIHAIFQDFYRVLKPGGRMIIFWPPEFGMSVIFFKGLTFLFKKILRRENVKFHPDEITRVRSKKQVTAIFNEEKFNLLEYYFGAMDFFTYSVIVAEKPSDGSTGRKISPLITNMFSTALS